MKHMTKQEFVWVSLKHHGLSRFVNGFIVLTRILQLHFI